MEKTRFSSPTLGLVPALPLTSCLALGKSTSLMPAFPPLHNGHDNRPDPCGEHTAHFQRLLFNTIAVIFWGLGFLFENLA